MSGLANAPIHWTWLAILLTGSIGVNRAGGQEGSRDGVEVSGREWVTPETGAAIEKGLAWLAEQQNEDGSFCSRGNFQGNVAITGLAGMSFLAAGHTPGRGRYGGTVSEAVGYILESTQPNGYIIEQEANYHGPMYGHGFAALFLAEVYGMSPRPEVRAKLEKAIGLIVDSQNDEGGWRYHPGSDEADISVTVCQVMTLRAARNAGLAVPKETIDRAVEYIRQCQLPDGGFRYRLVARRESRFPRSAAALVALYSAGIYEGQSVDQGLEYLMRFLPERNRFQRPETHYYYGQYYAVQAMWHAGGDYWRRWYPSVRESLLRRQRNDGRWPARKYCAEYGTAMALLVLQMPNNYLPIFQR